MKLSDYTFVALDLETTGLDPQTETIMEIAAIRFQLERDGDSFRVINMEERSMLIDPEREIRDEIRMITGITSQMLEGKEKWEDVRERVRDFIADSIIVGHNVLFDIAMLATHEIDLSKNITLDTFELSEIFSQEAESLNLMYLANHYGIEILGEHRALDDTRLSVGLFIHYLSCLHSVGIRGIEIFSYFIARDASLSLSTLLTLAGEMPTSGYGFPFEKSTRREIQDHTSHNRECNAPLYKSLSGSMSEELGLIRDALKSTGKVLLITNGGKQSLFWKKTLEEHSYKVGVVIEAQKYCSLSVLESYIEQKTLNRKEIIFGLKMLFWLEKTSTGLLDELKYYGEERVMVELFRSEEDEYSHFRTSQEAHIQESDILIADPWMKELRKHSLLEIRHVTIFRDIAEIEDTIRRSERVKISFRELNSDINYLIRHSILSITFQEKASFALAYFQDLIEHIHVRPTGPSANPPGEYGETYYFDQKDLWYHGKKWLMIIMNTLQDVLYTEQGLIGTLEISALERKVFRKISEKLSVLIHITNREDTNTGMIVNISGEESVLTLIPRDTSESVQLFIRLQSGEHTFLTGYGIDGPILGSFIATMCGGGRESIIAGKNTTAPKSLISETRLQKIIQDRSTIILLSTSNKHLRNLAEEIKRGFTEWKIFTQGISGGKGKILSLFSEYRGKKILLGLINSWIDESTLFQQCDSVILGKIPFDPPTDPYYLARTVGMSNNFEEYSCPLAIDTINTMIGRIRCSHPQAKIYCLDARLSDTLWGKKIFPEIL